MLSIAGNDFYGFFGEKGGTIGPCRVFYDTAPIPNATGTIEIAGNVVTGTGTSFTSLFNPAVGDLYFKVNTTVPQIFRVKTISSNTSMTCVDPVTLEDANVTVAPGTTFSLFRTLDLGRTNEEGVTLKISEKTADVKSAQEGDVAINTFSVGHEATIELTLLEASAEKIFYLLTGRVSRDANNNITGLALGDRIGRNFLKNSKQLTLILYKDGEISTDPRDRIDFFKVHFSGDIEKKMDATSVHVVKLTGKVFKSENHKLNGKPYMGAINYQSFTWET